MRSSAVSNMPSREPVVTVKLVPVMLVEDDLATQTRLAGILATLGIADNHIRCARTIASAQQVIENHTFSLALIDADLLNGNDVNLI